MMPLVRAAAWSLISIATVVVAASANAPPPRNPLPKGWKVVEPAVRFEGVDRYRDHVFYLHCWAVYGGKVLAEVKNGEPIKLQIKDKTIEPFLIMSLCAMPRVDFEKEKEKDPSLYFLIKQDGPKGIIGRGLTSPTAIAPEAAQTLPITTYRVFIKDRELMVDMIEPKNDQKKSDTGPHADDLQGFSTTSAIAGSASIAWLGIWFARRRPRQLNTA